MIRALLTLAHRRTPRATTRYLLSVAVSVILQTGLLWSLVALVTAWAHRDGAAAATWLASLLGCTVLGWVVETYVQRTSLAIGFALLDSVQEELTERVALTPSSWWTSTRREQAIHALSGIGPELVGAFGYVLTPALTAFALPGLIALTVLVAGLLSGAGLLLGGVAIAAWLVACAAYHGAVRVSARADKALHRATTDTGERLVEFAAQQRTLRAFQRADSEQSTLLQAIAAEKSAILRLILLQVPGQIMFSLALQIALAGISATALWHWAHGELSPVAVIGFILLAVRMLEPLTTLADIAGGADAARRLVAEIETLRHAPQLTAPAANRSEAPPTVELRDVSFSHAGVPILQNVSLTLPAGTTTALVGPSGAGKSTLLQLIAGLEQPDSGTVLIDGKPAAPGMASVVFQFPYLFSGSIAENIGVDPHPTAHDNSVLQQAQLETVVASRSEGLAAQVGESGNALSGGERQRVTIARALAHPSRLMLIDEASSSLDYRNEKALRDTLQLPGYTRLIISHRPGAIRGVDRVITLDGGRLSESGPHIGETQHSRGGERRGSD